VNKSPVETRALHKVFRDFWGRPRTHAVKGLDLEVLQGEIFGLLGPNGSGKSTTIKLVLGLLHPTSGEARVLGGSPRDVKLKARIGYLPEESYFYPHLTARETLLFFGDIFSVPRGILRQRTEELLTLVGLLAAADRRIGEFSKGMLRRIGLAQALVNDPELLILDEPTSGMDPMGTREVKDLLLDLRRRGKTVILSSHLLADVEDVCDRVAILHEGRLEAMGSVSDLLRDDERTQIITGRLSQATVDALTLLLREREGPALQVEIGKPSTRLEEFFLRVVGKPRDPADGGAR
jgi:ABC-2 type transport system ATP-binding protein